MTYHLTGLGGKTYDQVLTSLNAIQNMILEAERGVANSKTDAERARWKSSLNDRQGDLASIKYEYRDVLAKGPVVLSKALPISAQVYTVEPLPSSQGTTAKIISTVKKYPYVIAGAAIGAYFLLTHKPRRRRR